MKFTSVAVYGAALGLAHANPMAKRGLSDGDVLNYALTLEHLEATFYEEGLKNYTMEDFMYAGMPESFYVNMQAVARDEKTHESFLTKTLTAAGVQPVERCTYVFPATDVKTFLATASVLEGVGVSAYLGAAASLMDKTYLTAAGSILTDEARHSAYLRAALGEAPFAQPFDNPLGFNEVYTVASPFFASCPSSNPKLPLKPFPSLTMTSMAAVMTGSTVELVTGSGFDTSMNTEDVYAAFITVTGPIWAPLSSTGPGEFTVTIPQGVAGQSYVVLTKGNTQATDDNILAGPAIIEVGAKVGPMMGGCKTESSMPMSSSMSMSMPMPMSTPMAKHMATSSMTGTPSMSSGSMPATSSPVYNAANGIVPSNIGTVVGALAVGFFLH